MPIAKLKPFGFYPRVYHEMLKALEKAWRAGERKEFSFELPLTQRRFETEVRLLRACRTVWKLESKLAQEIEAHFFVRCNPIEHKKAYRVVYRARPPSLIGVDDLLQSALL